MPNQPAMARLLPEAQPFDAFASFDWFDDGATRYAPPPHSPPVEPETPVYLRTDVLAAGATLSVLLFLGLFGYALTRHESLNTTTKVPRELPAASTPVFALPVPPDPVDSLVSPPTPDPAPASDADDALPVAIAPQTVPTGVVPPTAVSAVVVSAAGGEPARSAGPSSTAASAARAGGRFTGVILAIRGDLWTFSLWDGSTVTLEVTANTQLTPKPSLLPRPEFVAGQTVAVFYSSAATDTGTGTPLVANRIYVV